MPFALIRLLASLLPCPKPRIVSSAALRESDLREAAVSGGVKRDLIKLSLSGKIFHCEGLSCMAQDA